MGVNLINTEYRGRVSHRELHRERGGGIQKTRTFSDVKLSCCIFSYIFLILESIQLFIFCYVMPLFNLSRQFPK
jgi:hypothetical protein